MQGPRVCPKDGGELAGAWTYPIASLHKLRTAGARRRRFWHERAEHLGMDILNIGRRRGRF
jgi:hypothetical protein